MSAASELKALVSKASGAYVAEQKRLQPQARGAYPAAAQALG